MGGSGLTEADGSLAADLVAALEPRLGGALTHPTRRGVLRALHGKAAPRSIGEIVAELPPLKRAEVSYHLQVLQDTDCAEERRIRPAPRGGERVFASCIAGDGQVQMVLAATEAADREHRRRLARRESPGTLAMFRVPGPALTIRLGSQGRSRKQNG